MSEPSGNQPQIISRQPGKLSSVQLIVVDLLIIIIIDRSTVAGLLLQFVGHVLLRLWPAAVSNDLLNSDFEGAFWAPVGPSCVALGVRK